MTATRSNELARRELDAALQASGLQPADAGPVQELLDEGRPDDAFDGFVEVLVAREGASQECFAHLAVAADALGRDTRMGWQKLAVTASP